MSINIQLVGGKTSIIDDIDSYVLDRVWYCWQGHGRFAVCDIKNHRLHRIIMENVVGRTLGKGDQVNHLNGDKFDNRRSNLVLVKFGQNFGRIFSEETRKKIGKANAIANKGKHPSEETRKKLSKSQIGHRDYRAGMEVSEETRRKLSQALKGRATRGSGWHHSDEYRRKKSEMQSGANSHFWKGGLTEKNRAIRGGVDYTLWREEVFKRDNWTCQDCKKRGGLLHAHHIKSFCEHPELRFVVENGVTLCRKCHGIRHGKNW